MTKKEFAKAYKDKGDGLYDLGQRGIIDEYKKKTIMSSEIIRVTEKYPKDVDYDRFLIVRKALSEGKTIPPEVLADYPDLQKQLVTPKVVKEGEGKELKKKNMKNYST